MSKNSDSERKLAERCQSVEGGGGRWGFGVCSGRAMKKQLDMQPNLVTLTIYVHTLATKFRHAEQYM